MASPRFQPPKGTRDWYPDDMAIRRHLESVWRDVSIRYGFDEVDGPTFEHLDLYKLKSGDEIVSQLFSFRRAGGDVDYALRPEFTPTLARMVAARGRTLPMPTKWFSMPAMFRAERPQRGRLREHIQYNCDIMGSNDLAMDAELIAVAVGILEGLGLAPEHAKIKFSHRGAVRKVLERLGVGDGDMQSAFELLDRREKLEPAAFEAQARTLGLDDERIARLDDAASTPVALGDEDELTRRTGLPPVVFEDLFALKDELVASELAPWCEYDLGIVRGLAYYTGTVFELHATSGRERAIAGGGRYDELVGLLGGDPTPAAGFAMGDVVIRLVLEDLGLLPAPEACRPRPDLFVIAADDDAARDVPRYVSRWRRAGLHVRHSYKSTRNVGKLLRDANRAGARWAVILGADLAAGRVDLKDLSSGEQISVAIDDVVAQLGGESCASSS